MKRVLVINGPNLNLLGRRQTNIYGQISYEELKSLIEKEAKKLKLIVDTFQSNHEGEIIDRIHNAQNNHDYIILNAGAYSNYSLAIKDAVLSISIPVLEVHLSNIFAREEFRSQSVISPVSKGFICGFGAEGYVMALKYIANLR